MTDRLTRRVLPRLVVALSQITWPAKLAARARRARGGRGRVELYVALDDPWSAVALLDLAGRLAGRPVDLDVRPVGERGIPGDPAVDAKRRYAAQDARRLARRHGWELEDVVRAFGERVPDPGPGALARNAKAMRRRGAYDTPAAVVGGRWYFAQDRPAQIVAWVDELGWRAA